MRAFEVGIAFDLRPPGEAPAGVGDLFEEYDAPETIEAIAAALENNGHAVRLLGGGSQLVRTLLDQPPDLVFNIAEGHGSRSREAHVPSVCEMLGVPFTHSDPTTLCLTLDKSISKTIVSAAGVPTPASVVLTTVTDELPLRFPVIAKPIAEGSSMGLTNHSRLEGIDDLRDEVRRLMTAYRQPVLVEEFCDGPEFTVGIRGRGDRLAILGVMEIVPLHTTTDNFVYSVDVKRQSDAAVAYIAPPERPAAAIAAIARVASDAYAALGCRDIARIDIRMNALGEPQFLEANPLPGLKPLWGDIVILAGKVGIAHDALIGLIVEEARARYEL